MDICSPNCEKVIFDHGYIKSVSSKIEPLQYIAIYYNGLIFNETDFILNENSIS